MLAVYSVLLTLRQKSLRIKGAAKPERDGGFGAVEARLRTAR